jgi:diguanylate cyclase (GGDEF)-like protein/putative nucleotidyltransferase with HDIG domain
MGDVNGLKLVNDSFGHQTGDQLLIKVSEVLKKACREDDIIARMGGDEFSILFSKTDEENAEKIIRRINRYLSLEKIGPLEVSVSIGFETKYEMDQSIEELIKKTEDHMYRHKLNESASMRYKAINLIMATLLEKNSREQKHSERVSSISVEIAKALGLSKDEINHVKTAGLMHDIGKIGIDENILNSSTILSNYEWEEVKKHSEIGFRILSSSPEFSEIAEAVYSHHERWDGKGYPRKLKGEEISIYARIITVADSFDAMISERPYRVNRKSMGVDEAINEIKKNAGTQFDPEVAKYFVEKVMNVVW